MFGPLPTKLRTSVGDNPFQYLLNGTGLRFDQTTADDFLQWYIAQEYIDAIPKAITSGADGKVVEILPPLRDDGKVKEIARKLRRHTLGILAGEENFPQAVYDSFTPASRLQSRGTHGTRLDGPYACKACQDLHAQLLEERIRRDAWKKSEWERIRIRMRAEDAQRKKRKEHGKKA